MRSEPPLRTSLALGVLLLLAAGSAGGAISTFTVATTPEDEAYPSVSGGVVVWQDDRAGNWDIYATVVGGRAEERSRTEDKPPLAVAITLIW